MGAVLDLGMSLPGFLHVSKISETERIESIRDVFSVGDKVTARIMVIRRQRERGRPPEIEVSQIDVPEFEDNEINIDVTVGQEVTGTVTGFNAMGAILDLGLPLPGYLHKSKISKTGYIKSIRDVFSVGDEVTAHITAIRRRQERGRPPEIEVSQINVPKFMTPEINDNEINIDATVG
eukprot:TRINITY_DN5752_c0_g1_i6.p1 TRINITY_DN5752_c0_g1~~TRINITY_DN5752_c0_g1_i6.p1  ORF type:complete len:178 (+),score=33.61 TRINITY_DN5752_c0_g1_i6:567-1100(+)